MGTTGDLPNRQHGGVLLPGTQIPEIDQIGLRLHAENRNSQIRPEENPISRKNCRWVSIVIEWSSGASPCVDHESVVQPDHGSNSFT